MKKNILVKAYLYENFGDDLFLKMLFDRYKDINWYLIDANSKYTTPFIGYNNVQPINFKEFIKNYRDFHGYINIGGSIFQQDDKKLGIKKHLLITTLLNTINKKTFILGSNFGPYNSDLYKKVYQLYFKFVRDICFREKKSYQLFKGNDNVRLAPDIVFGLEHKKLTKEENSVGISIIDLKNRANLIDYRKKYIKKMIELIHFLDDKGKKIYLLSFCKGEGDENIIHEVVSALNESVKNRIRLLFYKGNIDEYIKELQKIESIVACRFHSLILSQVFSQGVFPLVYSDKTLNVLNDIGLNSFYKKLEEIDSLDFNEVLKALHINKINIEEISNASSNHFQVLDNYLK